jgi:NMD protein affecting ribosome stability and mRNA decay
MYICIHCGTYISADEEKFCEGMCRDCYNQMNMVYYYQNKTSYYQDEIDEELDNYTDEA